MQRDSQLLGKLKKRVKTNKPATKTVTVRIDAKKHAHITKILKELGRGVTWQSLVEESVDLIIKADNKAKKKSVKKSKS